MTTNIAAQNPSKPLLKPLAAIHSFSDPISSLERLIYIYDSLIPVETILPKKPSQRVSKLVEHALSRQDTKRFTGPLEVYKDYVELLYDNLASFQDKQIIFLDFDNYTLLDRYGKTKRDGVDDFASHTEMVPKIFEMYKHYASHSSEMAQRMEEELLFWRMSPFPFPFQITGADQPAIYHPLQKELEHIQRERLKEGKFALGDFYRTEEQQGTQQNYSFNSTIFSIEKYRQQKSFIESSKEQYEHKREPISLEEFVVLNETAITLNRAFMKKLHQRVTDQQKKEPLMYMLNNDIGRHMVKKTFSLQQGEKTVQKKRSLFVTGGTLIGSTKQVPVLRALETQALNRLSGWIHALYGDTNTTPYCFRKDYTRTPPTVHQSWLHPGILTLGRLKELDDSIIRNVDPQGYALLEEELKLYEFSVSPVELLMLRLTDENFLVDTDGAKTTWQKETRGRKIEPHSIIDLKGEEKKYVRPSNSGVACEFAKYIATLSIDWQGMGDNKYSKVGNVIHQISNELISKTQQEILSQRGFTTMSRDLYCEVPITHAYSPSEEIWKMAQDYIEHKIDLSNKRKQKQQERLSEKDFYQELLHFFHKEKGATIMDGGHPDASLILEGTQTPVILDFKRRMRGYYPVPYFSKQLSRYALAIINGKQLGTDHFYTAVIQTPFHPVKYSQQLSSQVSNSGLHRKQSIYLRRMNLDGAFVKEVKKDLVVEYLGNKLLSESPELGFAIHDLYKDASPSAKPSCTNCFLNDVVNENFQCRYVMQGVKDAWPIID